MKTKKSKVSATQLSLKKLRAEGYLCAIVEHFNPWVKIRQDMFGFVDIVAVKENESLYIQTTTADHMEARIRKIMGHPNLPQVHSTNRTVIVHGWVKINNRWECREEIVTP